MGQRCETSEKQVMNIRRKGTLGKDLQVEVRLACVRFGKEAGVAAAR